MGIPDHHICLLRNLYAGQEATIRTRHEQWTDSKLGKDYFKGCILSSWLFNLYAGYIMQNPGLDDAQAGFKIAGQISTITDMQMIWPSWQKAKRKLKSLLKEVKEECEKAGLRLNIQKTKIMASDSITSWQLDGETVEIVADFISLGSKITVDCDYSHEIKWYLLLGRKAMISLDSMFTNRVISYLTKVFIVKALAFPLVMYGCESWTIKKAEHWRIVAFELGCWRRLESPLDCKDIKSVNAKGN